MCTPDICKYVDRTVVLWYIPCLSYVAYSSSHASLQSVLEARDIKEEMFYL